jgi:hypothetical protein
MNELLDPSKMSTQEVLKQIRQGRLFQCRICKAVIKTVPENWKPEMPLHGLVCPTDQRHFLIHCDDATAMKEIRAKMKASAAKR